MRTTNASTALIRRRRKVLKGLSRQGDPTPLTAAEASLSDVPSSTLVLERPVLRALKRSSHEDGQPVDLESSQNQASVPRAVRPRMPRYRAVGMWAGSSALAAVMLPKPIPAEKLARWHRTSPSAQPSAETRPIHDLAPFFEEQLPLHRRSLDIVASGMALVLVSPVLLTAAVLVKVSSPGPTIFAQTRAGRGGRPFQFYKLRSMYRDAEDRKNALRLVNEQDGPIFKIKNDPRITPVGRILRKFSIDELPQLFNVLRGDMTLVGPRPPVMDEVKEYETWQRQRLDITGGITCIWQVSGRSDVTFREWMRMDVRYRKQRSIGLDLKLVWKTFGAVFSGKGAY
ncbi:MAG: lipopolysaccharide/colanic/teichoic acid biosynthesis glycosyltransferase [Planctomycetota bacterium]